MGTPQQLFMSEEDVRQYLIQNGGIVRNNDIVTYFRSYLSNPSIRDEARALFKSYVNKLATVKVENEEKYLVLKRQFYPTLDGSGSVSGGGQPVLGFQGYESAVSAISTGLPQPQYTQYPFQGPPPYVPKGGFPTQNQLASMGYLSTYFSQESQVPQPPQPVSSVFQQPIHQLPHHISKSQPSLYGSQFSLSSNATNYTDPYLKQQMPPTTYGHPHNQGQGNTAIAQQGIVSTDYTMEYGLPPPPVTQKTSPPRRLSFSSPSSSNYGSNSSPSRLPPPYRPPPPAYVGSPPPAPSSTTATGRNPLNFRSPPSSSDYVNPPEVSGRTHYRRSLSASGLSGPPTVTINRNSVTGPTCSSAGDSSIPFFVTGGTPPPPVPPRAKRQSSFVDRSAGSSLSGGRNFGMEDYNKENANPVIIIENESGGSHRSQSTSRNVHKDDDEDSHGHGPSGDVNGESINGNDSSNGNCSAESTENESSEMEQKISVKERMQKFNRIASEGELPLVPKQPNCLAKNRRDIISKHESADYDTASLSSYGYGYQNEPKSREWILKAVRLDYHAINKMAQENPSLVKRRDINGYTALHWAAKHGHIELVKLLAGTFRSDVNAKSNGGYTPLHLAAQFSRQDVYEILVKAYNADANMRDHSGKKPMQYMVRQDSTAVSMDTFKSELAPTPPIRRRNSSASAFDSENHKITGPISSSNRNSLGVGFCGEGDSYELRQRPISPNSRITFFRSSASINDIGTTYHPDLVPSFQKSTNSTSLALPKEEKKKNQSFRAPFGVGLSDMRKSFRQGFKKIADKSTKGRDAF